MKHLVFILLFTTACSTSKQAPSPLTEQPGLLQTDQIQLSQPTLSVDSLIFIESSQVTLGFGLEPSEIYYSLDDAPALLYKHPIVIKESLHLKAQTRKQAYKDSDWIELTTVKVNNKTKGAELNLTPEPSHKYAGNGPASLIDLRKGNLDYTKNKDWLGFQTKEIIVKLTFKKQTELERITLSFLVDHNSWIFAPSRIEIWNLGKMLTETTMETQLQPENSTAKMIHSAVAMKEYKQLEIRIYPLRTIPQWHVGRGTTPWLFMDEIFID